MIEKTVMPTASGNQPPWPSLANFAVKKAKSITKKKAMTATANARFHFQIFAHDREHEQCRDRHRRRHRDTVRASEGVGAAEFSC
jgi:hypothetical protein